jgi:hypothetical protein
MACMELEPHVVDQLGGVLEASQFLELFLASGFCILARMQFDSIDPELLGDANLLVIRVDK